MACFCAEVCALDPWGAAGLDGESKLNAEGSWEGISFGENSCQPRHLSWQPPEEVL